MAGSRTEEHSDVRYVSVVSTDGRVESRGTVGRLGESGEISGEMIAATQTETVAS